MVVFQVPGCKFFPPHTMGTPWLLGARVSVLSCTHHPALRALHFALCYVHGLRGHAAAASARALRLVASAAAAA